MAQLKIKSMDNDSSYWAVLSKSSSGGDQGKIDQGHFAKSGTSFDFNNDLAIPENSKSENRMFIQTTNGDYRIFWEKQTDGKYTITINGFVLGVSDSPVWSKKGLDADQKFRLEIATDGSPSLS